MKGYSLLETVIYVAILAVITLSALGSVISIYQSFGKTRVERKLALNGDIAMERMIREIRSATATNIAGSVFSSNPGTLKLDSKTFFLSGSRLQIQDGANEPDNMTSSDVEVSGLIFYRSTATNSEIIKIEMTLESGAGKIFKSKNFYGGAVLRGIY